jgi:hypothetical protein
MTDFLRTVIAQSKPVCVECERVFDLFDEEDAEEWFYGHDCEAN